MDTNWIGPVTIFLIAALGIIFNPKISKQIDILGRKNDTAHRELDTKIIKTNEGIISLNNSVTKNTKILREYAIKKSILESWQEVVRDSVEHTIDSNLSSFITYSSNKIIVFMKRGLEIGVENLSKKQINGMIESVRQDIWKVCDDMLGKEFRVYFQEKRLKQKDTNVMTKDLLEVKNDPVNSKQKRVKNICERFLQNYTRDLAIAWSNFNNKKE